MAASATFTYNGTDTVTAHITGATVGHTIWLFVQDDDWAFHESMVAPSASFDFVYPAAVGCSPPAPRFVYAWDANDGNAVIGTTVFNISSGDTSEYEFPVLWNYDGASTVTARLPTSAADVIGLDVSIGDFDEFDSNGGEVSPGGLFTATLTLSSHTDLFFANVYRYTGSPYDVWGSRLFTPGVAGEGVPGNPVLPLPVPSSVIVTLDGTDVTQCCVQGSWTRRLNRPSTAQIRTNMECANAAVGTLLKIEALVGGVYKIVHHGRVLETETDTEVDGGYTVYSSTDPMEMWQWRPVRDNDCDFTKPQIIQEYTTGAETIEAALNNSVDCGDSSQADCEGDLFLTINAAASGGVDLTGAPTDWPITIAELVSLFVSTGTVDVVITPTDPGGGIMGEVDFYNGDFGTDRSATIIFSYGMGDYNVRRLRWNQDMTSMVNKLWYYAGPRIETPADPAGDQHWCFNVTGSDGGAGHIPPYTGGLMYPPGGDLSPPASATNNQLGVLRASSEAAYGVRMDIQIFDATDDNCYPGAPSFGHDLYRYRWQQEAWLRAQPREIIHVTPSRETEIGTFDIGDLVGVEASSEVRGGFSGAQRVYEYTVSWDGDGVLELSELQTSADNEGL